MAWSKYKEATITGETGTGTGYILPVKVYYNGAVPDSVEANATRLPSAGVYAAQAVAFDGTYFYTTGGNTIGCGQNTIYKFDASWVLQGSLDCTTDGPAGLCQINGIEFYNGKIYVTGNNYNTTPEKSWIIEINADLTYSQEWDISTYVDVAEDIVLKSHNGTEYFWVIDNNNETVTRYTTSMVYDTQWTLPITISGDGYNGSVWLTDNILLLNRHDTSDRCDMFFFGGDTEGFRFFRQVTPPNPQCGQGVYKYGNYLYWAERSYAANDHRVMRSEVTASVEAGAIDCEGNCKPDFSDVWFTNSDGSTKWSGDGATNSGWIEVLYYGVMAIIHVKVDDDLGSNVTMRCYYGDTAASWSGSTAILDASDDFESDVGNFSNEFNSCSASSSSTYAVPPSSASLLHNCSSAGRYTADGTYLGQSKKRVGMWVRGGFEVYFMTTVSGSTQRRGALRVLTGELLSNGTWTTFAGSLSTSRWYRLVIFYDYSGDEYHCELYDEYLSLLASTWASGSKTLEDTSKTYRDILLYGPGYTDRVYAYDWNGAQNPSIGVWGAEQNVSTPTVTLSSPTATATGPTTATVGCTVTYT